MEERRYVAPKSAVGMELKEIWVKQSGGGYVVSVSAAPCAVPQTSISLFLRFHVAIRSVAHIKPLECSLSV